MSQISEFIPHYRLNAAVLFLVFNRPDKTKQVFEAIRQAKPPRLYIAADGPREEKEGEADLVEEVRSFIMNNIDWPCEVKTLFRENNLGCKYAVSGAITWFFEQEEEGIILEDDCLPSHSFFRYCDELLLMYRNDLRIMLITGYNKQSEWNNGQFDYFFSYFGGIWGWATWKRAWDHYDINMNDFNNFTDNDNFRKLLGNELGIRRQNEITSFLNNNIDSWDYQWAFARHKNNGLACVPKFNLIENIGYGDDATHTFKNNNNVKKRDIEFPLRHNKFVIPDRYYDEIFIDNTTILRKILNFFKK